MNSVLLASNSVVLLYYVSITGFSDVKNVLIAQELREIFVYSCISLYIPVYSSNNSFVLVVEGEADGVEKVLYSYGFGTSVPSCSRRRMQQR